ncbi:MAG: glycosyltransferase [Pirellulaceae bacterium]
MISLRRYVAWMLCSCPRLFGEGMPMVVLEALAAAVPVVATRVEGTPEVIRDGIEGLLAEPGMPRRVLPRNSANLFKIEMRGVMSARRATPY